MASLKGGMKFFFTFILLGYGLLFSKIDEEQFLERLRWERTKKRPASYRERTLLRPYGTSLDGEYVLIEKRIYKEDRIEFFFHLHSLIERTRSIFPIPSRKKRAAFLKYFRHLYRIEAGGFEYKGLTADLSYRDIEFHRTYRVEVVDHPQGYYELNFSLEVLGERLLYAKYPILEKTIGVPVVQGLYFFDEERGVGVKFSYKVEHEKNEIRYREDILCFHEVLGQNLRERILRRKEEFNLSAQQKKIRFLTDTIYNLFGVRSVNRHYYLDGSLKEERVAIAGKQIVP